MTSHERKFAKSCGCRHGRLRVLKKTCAILILTRAADSFGRIAAAGFHYRRRNAILAPITAVRSFLNFTRALRAGLFSRRGAQKRFYGTNDVMLKADTEHPPSEDDNSQSQRAGRDRGVERFRSRAPDPSRK